MSSSMPGSRKESVNSEMTLSHDREDYIAIHSVADALACARKRLNGDDHLKPVIDFTNEYRDLADLCVTTLSAKTRKKIQDTAQLFKKRRGQLPYVVTRHQADSYRFLSWLYVSELGFRLVYNSAAKESVSHSPFVPVENAPMVAQKLYQQGYLSRIFFDRFHQCGSCGSTRLNVREECMTCRSANIEEEEIIHHFNCGWQGPESDYTQKRDLVCPKCNRHLTHYGSDYEKSGLVMHCHDCNDSHSAASVGFLCLDCNFHQDSESMKTITHYNYALNDKGLAYLMKSHDLSADPALPDSENTLQVKQLPLLIQQEIIGLRLGIAPSRNEGIHPFVLMEFSYSKAFELITLLGEKAFTRLRHRLHDNLRAIIREHDLFAQGSICDYLLLKETNKKTVLGEDSAFIERCQHEIDHDLGIIIRAFNPGELSYGE